ncbi:MAG: diguanylate cyclase [Clostridia bacterium]
MENYLLIDANILSLIILIYTAFYHLKQCHKTSRTIKLLMSTTAVLIAQITLDSLVLLVKSFREPNLYILAEILVTISYLLPFVLSIFWALFAYSYITKDKKMHRHYVICLLLPMIVTVTLLAINIYTNCLFEITNNCEYIRGPLYLVYGLIGFIYLAVPFVVIIKYREDLSFEEFFVFLAYPALNFIASVLQNVFNGAVLISPFTALGMSILFVYLGSVLSSYDALTGAITKLKFNKFLKELIAKKDTNYSFVLIDLDDLHTLNDTYGYNEGDKILDNFVTSITEIIEAPNLVARYGGDEFILYFNSTDTDYIEDQLLRISNNIMNTNMASNKPYSINYSSTFATCNKAEFSSPYELIKHLQYLMYYEKLKKDERV